MSDVNSDRTTEKRSDPKYDYWDECIAIAFEEAGITATREQGEYVAGAVQGSHENYGMAHYTPPSSDRLEEAERKWTARLDARQKELDALRKEADDRADDLIRSNRRLRWKIEELEKASG